MKYTLTLLSLFMLLIPQMLKAQHVGCELGRYTNEVFEDFTVTTVGYGRNMNAILQNQVLEMDIYTPENDDQLERPLIITAHGGSFISGSREDMDEFCVRLVKRGFVCATIDYRLWPFLILGFPDSSKVTQTAFGAISDMKAAVRFFRQSYENGNPYGIDTSYIAIGGGSAGAITAIHAAYIDPADDLPQNFQDEINRQGGFEGNSGDSINMTYSSKVHSVYNLSGAIFDTSWINPGDIPIFSIQGTADDIVPYALGKASGLLTMMGSQLIHQRADEVGVINGLISVEGGGHSNIYSEEQFSEDVNAYEGLISEFWTEEICGITSSVMAINESKTFTAYPNPTTSYFQIVLDDQVNIQSINVSTLGGHQIPISYQHLGNKARVDVPDVQGIFIAQVNTSEGLYFKKIVINNK